MKIPPALPRQMTARQRTEQMFHDGWARSLHIEELAVRESFEAETALENRHAYAWFGDMRGKRMLDLGCGAGETSVFFALQGAQVTATDLSFEFVHIVRQLAERHNVQVQTVQVPGEKLCFADNTFDYVFGNGVLHHLDFEPAAREIARVLKPGGRAAFVEPLPYNPVIEVYRHLAKTVRTPDETPFRFRQLRTLRSLFQEVHHREFWLASLLVFIYFFAIERAHPSKERYWKKIIVESPRYTWLFRPLNAFDRVVLKVFPPIRYLCWNTVLTLVK